MNLFHELDLHIVQQESGEVVIGHPLILVDQPDLFWPRQADVTAIRTIFGAAKSKPTRTLYISRATTFRQPARELELQQELGNSGVEIVSLADHSIRDQWAIAQGSRTIVGLHGAALWASAALQPETRLIELSSGELFEGCYRRMAHLNGIAYRYVALPATSAAPFGDALESAPSIRRCLKMR